MPSIQLPDGSQRSFDKSVSVFDVAADIGTGLAKAALAGKVDGELVDTSFVIEEGCQLAIVTAKDQEGVEVIRHSCAHLLAQAVKSLFPAAQVTIGPVIENGFYYDFAFERSFTPEDITKIEAKMKSLVKENIKVERSTMTRDEAVKFFREMGEEYKAKIIEDIPVDQTLSLYKQGDFIDLCRGPHVPSTGHIKAFKLTKLAGAYWRGDSNNEMLQRIYGTAWADKKDLKEYMHRLEEAEKRDHRKIAKLMDLFHIQEEAPGMIFWHSNGWQIYQVVKQYIRQKVRNAGYQEINTPQIAERTLWEKSGHWANYRDEMFITQSEERVFAVKPMSCPCHIQVFNQGLKSYRDLPIRYTEFGCCHRDEASGALHGLMRVRGFTQDDGHIFCRDDQVEGEALAFVKLLFEVYRDFGFDDVEVKLSTRPEKRVGEDSLWDKAEADLEAALEKSGLDWSFNHGDGAFYGPKIDFSLKDSIGRVWQLATLQLDYCLPDRLGAEYVAIDGTKKVPVMLHRAILGSLERFIGVLIEHHAGNFPLWLAPWQAVVMNITDKQASFVQEVTEILQNNGLRVKSDLRNEKVGFKIREHTISRVPFLIVIGDKEVEAQTISVRRQDGTDLGSMSVNELIQLMRNNVATYSRMVEEEVQD